MSDLGGKLESSLDQVPVFDLQNPSCKEWYLCLHADSDRLNSTAMNNDDKNCSILMAYS